jgi:hypothetical protein
VATVTRHFIAALLLTWTLALPRLIADVANPANAPKSGLGILTTEAGLGYFSIAKVQGDLQLSDAQVGAIAKRRKESIEAAKQDWIALKANATSNTEEMRKKVEALGQIRRTKTDEKLRHILTQAQVNRAWQLALQIAGGEALMLKPVADSLSLTTEQLHKLKALQDAAVRDLVAFQRAHRQASVEETLKYLGDAREKNRSAMMDVLSSEQRRKFIEFQGPKVEITPEETRNATTPSLKAAVDD